MSPIQKEQMRLLELKKLQVLNQDELKERMKLELKHKEFMHLTYTEMEAKLRVQRQTSLQAGVQSPFIDDVVNAYKEQYAQESWYEEPGANGNDVQFKFASEEELANFFMKQSEKGASFVMYDVATKKVMAYSNGDGHLYHANGGVVKAGEKIKPSDIDEQSFEIPNQQNARNTP
ncbi:hypothetical protein [Legionella drancourtii]|uniref:Substrate of the Dot/Icm secretion system n=1 Tax=Legionella drancourtii LLAP12 TaxID=658187 RepID=G9END1_9GAMM|nr:hypothetical protein [Legionella drancourtii]EHL31292.1 hypothetical protein LDG_6753 [Legionella drancourtii LLAP12]